MERVAKEHVKIACFTLETRSRNERSFDMEVCGAGTANSMNQQMSIMLRISRIRDGRRAVQLRCRYGAESCLQEARKGRGENGQIDAGDHLRPEGWWDSQRKVPTPRRLTASPSHTSSRGETAEKQRKRTRKKGKRGAKKGCRDQSEDQKAERAEQQRRADGVRLPESHQSGTDVAVLENPLQTEGPSKITLVDKEGITRGAGKQSHPSLTTRAGPGQYLTCSPRHGATNILLHALVILDPIFTAWLVLRLPCCRLQGRMRGHVLHS